jgi:hypothetical protein
MDESRFNVANVHHVYVRFLNGEVNGHECLCKAVMFTHREVTEHIIDAYRDDLRAKVKSFRNKWQRSVDRDPDGKLAGYDRAHVAALDDVLALFGNDK